MKVCQNLALKAVIAVSVVGSLVSPLSVRPVMANKVSNSCNNATVAGAYGLQDIGSRKTKNGTVDYTAVRTAKFDGNGNHQGKGISSIDGVIRAYTITATYKVATDCTFELKGTQTFEDGTSTPYSQFGVVIRGGKEIIELQTISGRNQPGRYQRIENY